MRENYTELLLLPDGRILVHNLTPAMAALLHQIDPGDQSMIKRAIVERSRGRKSRTEHRTPITPHKP
jgi:hypothetical protein